MKYALSQILDLTDIVSTRSCTRETYKKCMHAQFNVCELTNALVHDHCIGSKSFLPMQAKIYNFRFTMTQQNIKKKWPRNPIKRCRKTLFQLIDLMKTLTKCCWTPFYCEFDINYNLGLLTNINDTKIWNQTQVGLS